MRLEAAGPRLRLALQGVDLLEDARQALHRLLDRAAVAPAVVGAHFRQPLLSHDLLERHRQDALDQLRQPRPGREEKPTAETRRSAEDRRELQNLKNQNLTESSCLFEE